MILLPLVVSAHDIEVQNADGKTIYYNYINDGTELEVTFRGDRYDSYSNEYQGNVVIPEEVTFMNRTRKVTSIGYRAFADCSGLTSVTIPNSVTSIENSAFTNCFGLKKVIVKDIAAWCGIKFGNSFSNPLTYAKHLYSDEDTEITNLIIPNSVTSIGHSAFLGCSGLTSVTIPNSVTSIGDEAFWNCSGLTSITIPNSVTSIGDYAFEHCYGLTSVTIGSGVTSIGESAFEDCYKLTSVIIPNSVTSIGDKAFCDCPRLTSVTIPNSMTSIGNYAFYYCYGLTSITIPNSVTSIGNYAFDGVDLTTVVSLIEKPFVIEGKSSSSRAFSVNTFNNATLFVPVGTIDKYKATYGWKDFAYIVEGTPTGIKVIENTQKKNATVYDLNGVRLSEPKKGINIINGQKVIVK